MKFITSVTAALFAAVMAPLDGADGVVFYQRIPSATAPITLGRVNADGSDIQPFAVNLPSVFNPTVSRNGRLMLVTSPDPGRPFKLSRNVYVIDLLTGATGRATSYEDEVELGGVRFRRDLAQLFGNNTISSYKINFPNYKAFSPDGTRVVVMNLFKSGVITLGTQFGVNDVQASSGRFPIVDVYNVSDALPAGPYVFLGAQERDGFNQGGDGVDWHPVLNEVVAAVASDVPAVGTGGRTSMEGTVLAVFSTVSISPFIRKLTNPVGQIDAFFNVSPPVSTAAGPHDYAPAISPDGTRVAFVRHILRQDSRFDGAGIAPLPALCSIHIIDYNGANDREILRLNEGLWITQLAWAPDGSEIAFDLAPQSVVNGFNSQSGDAARAEINVVGANGANPRLLVGAPASFPTWSPFGFTTGPTPVPTVRIRIQGQDLVFELGNLVPGRIIAIERTTDLQNWAQEFTQVVTSPQQSLLVSPPTGNSTGFYRIRIL